MQAYALARLVYHYALPVGMFAYCYGRIFHIIRRQSKVVTGQARTATTSRDQVQQQQTTGAGATAEAKLSRTELNVIKTMIAVIVCFIACWSVFTFANLLLLLKVSITHAVRYLLTTHHYSSARYFPPVMLSPRTRWPRGQNFVVGLGLGLEGHAPGRGRSPRTFYFGLVKMSKMMEVAIIVR